MILSSGVQYARDSIEFRLAMWSYTQKNAYRRQYDSWVGDVMMSLLFVAGAGKISEDVSKKCLGNLNKSLMRIGNLLSLRESKQETESESKKRENDHISVQTRYATALARLGSFGSIDQLEAAIVALNQTISENNSRNNNGADAGTTTASD